MAMEQKAFVFQHDAYTRELSDLLVDSLRRNDATPLRHFVEQHFNVLKDPYSGDRLRPHSLASISPDDVQKYGALALTKYYDPAAGIGLHGDWQDVFDALERVVPRGGSMTLGDGIGTPDHVLDPGKLGTFIQSPDEVRSNLARVDALLREEPALRPLLTEFRDLLARAAPAGLYVTF
jgi:hypothetical protein